MDLDVLTALVGFAFVTSVTPGPNNLMLMTSGANFGLLRTVPHMLGVSIGFLVMCLVVGAGAITLFERVPESYVVLKVLAVGYMLWLAWKFAHAHAPEGGAGGARPMGFWQAAAFQWVNPKALAMALTAITAYAPDRSLGAVAVVACAFAAVNLPTVSSWVVLGQQMKRFLTNPRRLAMFNWSMAGLLVLSIVPVVLA